MCNFIPDFILKNIGDKDSRKYSDHFRYVRALSNLNGGIIPIPAEHDEIRVLYRGNNDYNLDQSEKNIVLVDRQHHSAEHSANSNLELFNKIYDFMHDVLDRESFDDKNAVMKIFQDVGYRYNNAFWDGEVFAFGNGDGHYFNSFFIQNVATHEAFHAVTEYTAGLVYQGQSGALNESMSDVFAVCLDQYLANQSPQEASWLIGEGLFTAIVKAKGLRSFKDELAYDDPLIGTDPQPKHMRDIYDGDDDNGGVHINSGIINHAFYRFCIRSDNQSWTIPMQLWYQALLLCNPLTDFKEFAMNTIKIGQGLLTVGDYIALVQAWDDVGIDTVDTPEPEPPVPDPEKKSIWQKIIDIIYYFLNLFRK